MTFRATHAVRVGYVDTDRAGVVHHSTYLRYLEQARVEYLRERGVDYRRFELEEKKALPVVRVALAYRAPARFDDALVVSTWVGHASRAKVRFDSEVRRGAELLLTGEITLACVVMPEGRICSMPEEVIAACGGEHAS